MRSLFWTLLLILQSCLVHAIHKTDAGVVDWYRKLVGVPLTGNTVTAPSFRRIEGKELILTATTSNVLAVLDPEDGHVAWRYIFEAEDRIAGYYTYNNVVATLSGPGGAMLRTFDIRTGVMLIEKQLHPPELGHLSEPHFFGKHVAFSGHNSTDIYILTNGHTFVRLDQTTGEIKWSFEMPDASSLVIHTKLVLTPSALYLVGIAKSVETYTFHVTSLVPETGELITSANIPSSIKEPMSDFLVLSNGISNNNRIVWLEQGSLKHVSLVPELNSQPVSVKHAGFEQLFDVGLLDHGYMVAIKKGGIARIVKLVDNGIKTVYEFEDSAPSNLAPQSIYGGNMDETGRVHIARTYWDNREKKVALEIYSGNKELSIAYFDFDTANNGVIAFVALNAKGSGPADMSPQLLVSTFTGNVQLIEDAAMKWNRDECLTTAVVSEFVELPPPKAVVGNHDEESFAGRLIRHVVDLQKLPAYILHFFERFITDQSAVLIANTKFNPDDPVRDEFGFRQIIVVATMFGKVYGIDSATGEVVWTRLLGLGWAAEVGGRVIPVKLFVFNGEGVGDKGKGMRSDVVLVAQRRAENTLVDTVVFHIDAATGGDATGKIARNDVFEGMDVVQGPIVESYLLEHEGQKIAIFLDEYLQVYTYPDTPEASKLLDKLAPSLHFALRTGGASQGTRPQQRRLIGHQIAKNDALSRDRLVAYPVWTLSLPESEDVIGLISPNKGPVASYGKVLASRSTLYKYLNPHMSVVLTAGRGGLTSADITNTTTANNPSCGVYVVDNVKGTIIYRASLPATPGLGAKCDVKAVLTDNWLVYHYYDPDEAAIEEVRGWRMVSVELYEGGIDEKTKSSESSSYSKPARVTAFEDTFVFPQGITAMTTTKTKYGISTKDIIVATKSNKIQSYPKRMLDPRRPRQKPTNEELEEGLVQYDPVLPDNPKIVLSHEYDIANTQRIITAPSLLESTSLVFTSGLDMFLTRTSPSGTFDLLSENFNKKQLILTIAGLLVAIVVARPVVKRKSLSGKWHF